MQISAKEQDTNPKKQRANMDVPLATNDIRILQGFKGYRRKSSTFRLLADVDGLSVLLELFLEKTSKFWLRKEHEVYKKAN